MKMPNKREINIFVLIIKIIKWIGAILSFFLVLNTTGLFWYVTGAAPYISDKFLGQLGWWFLVVIIVLIIWTIPIAFLLRNKFHYKYRIALIFLWIVEIFFLLMPVSDPGGTWHDIESLKDCKECDFTVAGINIFDHTNFQDKIIVDRFGNGCQADPHTYERKYYFIEEDLMCEIDIFGQVVRFSKIIPKDKSCLAKTSIGTFVTGKGIKFGDSEEYVKSIYGLPYLEETNSYDIKRLIYNKIRKPSASMIFYFINNKLIEIRVQGMHYIK